MKILLIILAVIVVVLVGLYILSRIVLVATISGAGPAGNVETEILDSTSETGLRIRITLIDTESEQTITTISMPRQLANNLDASSPDGFIEEPLKPDGSEVNDPESMKFINEWNQEHIQWTGQQLLIPKQEVVFVIPATSPSAGSGHIQFQYGSKGRFFSVIAGFAVSLGDAKDKP